MFYSVLLFVTAFLPPPAVSTNPLAREHQAALVDARKLGPLAGGVRYLTLYNIPEGRRPEVRQVLDYWVNSLSREADVHRVAYVSPTLLRLQVRKYGWDPAVYDKLADEDPYFHVQLLARAGTTARAYFPAGQYAKTAGWIEAQVVKDKKIAAIAPWLPPAEAAELVALTQSAAPILRADWFLSRVAIQEGRAGTGYYDWLGLKARADFDALIQFDRKKSQGIKREVAAIVRRSGVGRFPRQIFREQALTGGRWETRDQVADNRDEKNALRQLDGDYKHNAEEIYGVLPNGLFVYFLSNDKGDRQDSAPDGIGFHHGTPGNDGKIHIGLACTACHIEGLRPIDDWGRRVFRGPLKLTSPDPEKQERLEQLYLGELTQWVDDDTAIFARALKRANGLTPEANAKAVLRVWERYVEREYTPADVAADLGLDEQAYLKILRANFQTNPLADPVLASHLADPPIPLRSDDLEQLVPLLYPTILGVAK